MAAPDLASTIRALLNYGVAPSEVSASLVNAINQATPITLQSAVQIANASNVVGLDAFINPAAGGTPILGNWAAGGAAQAVAALDLANCGVMAYPNTGSQNGSTLYFMSNCYYNGSNYIYKVTGGCATLVVLDGAGTGAGLQVYTAGVGTAGNIVNFGTNQFQVNQTQAKILGFGVTAAAMVDMTPDTGTFTGTAVGVTGLTWACKWSRVGNLVILVINNTNATGTGTSTSTGLSMTGLPAVIQPTGTQFIKVPFFLDNGANTDGSAQIGASGTIVFFKGTSGTAASWTNGGVKGIPDAAVIPYIMN